MDFPWSPIYPPLSPHGYMNGPFGPYLRSFYSPFSLYIDQHGAARAWLKEQYRCSLSPIDKGAPLHQIPSSGNLFDFHTQPCTSRYKKESTDFGAKSENLDLDGPKPVLPAASVYSCRNCRGTAKRPVVMCFDQVYCWACLFEPISKRDVEECTILPQQGEQRLDWVEVTATEAPTGTAMDHGPDLEEGIAMEEFTHQEVSHVPQRRPKRNRNKPEWMKDYICC